MSSTRVLSGVRATGRLHLGNYLGALRQWTSGQSTSQCFYFIADLHGLTELGPEHDGERFARERGRTAASLLAVGLDASRVTMFLQSAVPQHTELMWYLAAVARKGELERMTQWKDKAGANQAGASAGLFVYPVLMAADILLYDANEVPVGDDQRQHVEVTRDWAERFNSYFGRTFVIPQAVIPAEAARIMDLQTPGSKMSKSGKSELGTVFLDDKPDEIQEKIKRAVTDNDGSVVASKEKAGISNLIEIYSAITGSGLHIVENEFAGRTYGEFKNAVADAVIAMVDPIRTRIGHLMTDPAELDRQLAEGAERAGGIAIETCQRVRRALGLA